MSAMADAMFYGEEQSCRSTTIGGNEIEVYTTHVRDGMWFIATCGIQKPSPLTKRQQDIMQLLVDDKTIQQCAREMGISISSVQSHLQAARVRTGCETNIAMAAILTKHSWVRV